MSISRTKSGSICKLCTAKGRACHLHGGSPAGSPGSLSGSPKKASSPKKGSPKKQKSPPKPKSPVRAPPDASRLIRYSEVYSDDQNDFRHVILPPSIFSQIPRGRLMTEAEWRSLGVQQSRGWVHYAIHKPEPHILLFRRPKRKE